MANYSLVVDSTYTPFTLDELVKPYALYTEAYNKIEDTYNKLAEDSAKWGNQLDENSEAYKLWKATQDAIVSGGEALSGHGLSPGARQELNNTRRLYNSNIKAIEAADVEYKKALDLREKMMANDETIRYKNPLTIDNFLHGKTGSSEHLSGTKLREETADMASKLGAALFSDPSYEKALNSYYYEIESKNGAPAAMIDYVTRGEYENLPHGESATAQQNAFYEKIKAFADMYQNQVDRTNEYQDREALITQINQGLYSGLQKPARQYERNLGVMTASEKANYNQNAQQHAARMKAQGYNPDGTIDTSTPQGKALEKSLTTPSSSSSSSSSSGSSSSSRVSAYTESFVSNGTSRTAIKDTEDKSITGQQVIAEVSSNTPNHIDVVFYNNGSKTYLGYYDTGTKQAHTRGLKSAEQSRFEEYFGEDWDDDMQKPIKDLLQSVGSIYNKEKTAGLNNYNYYVDPSKETISVQVFGREIPTTSGGDNNFNPDN